MHLKSVKSSYILSRPSIHQGRTLLKYRLKDLLVLPFFQGLQNAMSLLVLGPPSLPRHKTKRSNYDLAWCPSYPKGSSPFKLKEEVIQDKGLTLLDGANQQ